MGGQNKITERLGQLGLEVWPGYGSSGTKAAQMGGIYKRQKHLDHSTLLSVRSDPERDKAIPK